MRSVNDMVETLQKQAGVKLREMVATSPQKYKVLLKELILQCLIKMMEVNIKMRVRKSDMELVQSVMGEAVAEYK